MVVMSTKKVELRDDLEFLVEFVSEVQKYRAIYDPNHEKYNQQFLMSQHWAAIADKFHATAESCRAKWQNIRCAYNRSLRKQEKGQGYMKPYYMAPYLTFLNDFNKSDKKTRSKNVTKDEATSQSVKYSAEVFENYLNDSDCTEEAEYEPDYYEDEDPLSKPINCARESTTSSSKSGFKDGRGTNTRKRLANNFKPRTDNGNPAKKTNTTETCTQHDSCELFLLSVAPRMRLMTPKQQLQFQIGILHLFEEVDNNAPPQNPNLDD